MKSLENYYIYNEQGPYRPRKGKSFVKRENVALIICYKNNFFFLSWNEVNYQKSLVTGGIEIGEEKEETVKRELIEETGYYDIESIIPVDGINISRFYVEHKDQNREAIYYPYLVILKSLTKIPISKVEQKEHSVIRIKKDKIKDINLFDNHRYMLEKALER